MSSGIGGTSPRAGRLSSAARGGRGAVPRGDAAVVRDPGLAPRGAEERGALLAERGVEERDVDERGAPPDERGALLADRGPLLAERGPLLEERGAPPAERGPLLEERGPLLEDRGLEERGAPPAERGVEERGLRGLPPPDGGVLRPESLDMLLILSHGGPQQRRPRPDGHGLRERCPAASYSPTQYPAQYHRR